MKKTNKKQNISLTLIQEIQNTLVPAILNQIESFLFFFKYVGK